MRMTGTRLYHADEMQKFIDGSMTEIDAIYSYADYLFNLKEIKRGEKYIPNSKRAIQSFAESLEQSIASYCKYAFANGFKCKSGYFYIISNPSFPNYYKLGFSLDCVDRLNQYQTYCPKRDFKIEKYVAVTNARQAERSAIMLLGGRMENEWFHSENINNDWTIITKEIAISLRENNRFYYKPI